jgi:hypothetical protein
MTEWACWNYHDWESWLKAPWLCEHTDKYLDEHNYRHHDYTNEQSEWYIYSTIPLPPLCALRRYTDTFFTFRNGKLEIQYCSCMCKMVKVGNTENQ